jgi:hypothetical protein
MREGVLVKAHNSGRYAMDDPDDDLTSGQALDIWLGGQWIPGRLEHAGAVYVVGDKLVSGYYFEAEGSEGDCGLAVGMRVRLPG